MQKKEEEKDCVNCKNSFPATLNYFYKNTSGNLSSYCKNCAILKSQERRNLNEKELIEYDKERYVSNQDNVRQRRKERYKENPDKEKKHHDNWIKTNKDKLKTYRLSAKKHQISKSEWLRCKKYFNNCCGYCGMTEEEQLENFGQDFSKDHFYNTGSDTIDNCIPACKSCNSSKRKQDGFDWYNIENPIFNSKRKNRIKKWLNNFL